MEVVSRYGKISNYLETEPYHTYSKSN
jgi:hypothetical protein